MTTTGTTLLAVLAFLGAVATVGTCVLTAIGLTIAHHTRLAAASAAVAGVVVAGYAAVLLASGAASEERTLGAGASKVLCELDCHLAYSVRRARAEPTADGARYVVTVRTYFDPASISPRRGDAPLWPNGRRVRLVDADGREWAATSVTGTSIDTPLRPGESYETTFAFDVPAGVRAPRLALTESEAVTRLLIGHENAPLHRKTLFALGARDVATR